MFILIFIVSKIALAQDPFGTIVQLHGSVLISSGNLSQPAELRQALHIGDSIETKAKSFVRIEKPDGSKVNVGANSRLDLSQTAKEKVDMLDLLKGEIRANITKEKSGNTKMVVKAGSAAMGVRGTDFAVLFNPTSQMASLFTFEGSVAMVKFNPQESILETLKSPSAMLVNSGNTSFFKPGLEGPATPKIIPAQQMEKFKLDGSEINSQNRNSARGKSGDPRAENQLDSDSKKQSEERRERQNPENDSPRGEKRNQGFSGDANQNQQGKKQNSPQFNSPNPGPKGQLGAPKSDSFLGGGPGSNAKPDQAPTVPPNSSKINNPPPATSGPGSPAGSPPNPGSKFTAPPPEIKAPPSSGGVSGGTLKPGEGLSVPSIPGAPSGPSAPISGAPPPPPPGGIAPPGTIQPKPGP